MRDQDWDDKTVSELIQGMVERARKGLSDDVDTSLSIISRFIERTVQEKDYRHLISELEKRLGSPTD